MDAALEGLHSHPIPRLLISHLMGITEGNRHDGVTEGNRHGGITLPHTDHLTSFELFQVILKSNNILRS